MCKNSATDCGKGQSCTIMGALKTGYKAHAFFENHSYNSIFKITNAKKKCPSNLSSDTFCKGSLDSLNYIFFHSLLVFE